VEDRLGYELKRAQQALRTAMDKGLERHGLTTAQYAALAMLEDASGISSAELARRCFVTPQTMNVIVAGLERRGLLERRAHPVHGRILETTLTGDGAALLELAHEQVRAIEAQMSAQLSTTERRQLFDLLGRCTRALGATM
jgi:DNA-binding MarR family transcriptional regulator